MGDKMKSKNDKLENISTMIIRSTSLIVSFDCLLNARNNLSHSDFVKIWGETLGTHIWRQSESDLIQIWGSGLNVKEKGKLIKYLANNFFEENKNDK